MYYWCMYCWCICEDRSICTCVCVCVCVCLCVCVCESVCTSADDLQTSGDPPDMPNKSRNRMYKCSEILMSYSKVITNNILCN